MATETRWIQGQVSGVRTFSVQVADHSIWARMNSNIWRCRFVSCAMRSIKNGPQSGPRQEQGWLTYRWTDGMAEKAGSA